MPNRAAQLRSEIEAAHPDVRLAWRHETGIVMRRPGFIEQKVSTGPVHWKQPGDVDWREIDTDLEDRPHVKWSRGIKSARFDTLLAEDGSRRFIPRRWLPDEWVEFGPLQWRGTNWTTPQLGAGELRGENGLRGAGNRLCFDRAAYAFEVGFFGTGSRTSLTLKSASVARPLRWKVDLHGLDLKDGVLVSVSDAEQVGFIRPPSWSDASGPEPHPVEPRFEGGYLIVEPDLKDAQFPVVVDPDYSIAAGADDGLAAALFSNSGVNLIFGKYATDDTYKNFMRFTGIAATQGQDCTAATITFKASYDFSTTTINCAIFGIDEDDTAAPTSLEEIVADCGLHHATHVHWYEIPAWTLGSTYVTPDLSAIVDVLLARANWVTGDPLQFHVDNDGTTANYKYRYAASYDNTTYTEPILSLTLAAGGTSDEVSPATIACTTSIGAPTVKQGSSTSPATIACVAAVLAFTLTAGQTASPSTVAATTAVPAVTVEAGQTAGPAAVAVVVGMPAATIVGGQVASPAPIACVVTVPAASVPPGQYLRLDGTGYATSDYSTAITGDLDVRVRCRADDWTTAAPQIIMIHSDLNTVGWFTYLYGGEFVLVGYATVAGQVGLGAALPALTDGATDVWLRGTVDVDDGAGGMVIGLYYSLAAEPGAGDWTLLDSQIVAAADTLTDPERVMAVSPPSGPFLGCVYRAEIRSAGSLVASPYFDSSPWDSGETVNQDGQGNTWTLYGTAHIAPAQIASPAVIACTAAIPAVTVPAGQSTSPATIPCLTAIPAATVGTTTGTRPPTIACTVTVPAVTLGAGQTASPAVIACTAALPAVSTTQGQQTSPATIQAVAAFPAATGAAGQQTAPSTIVCTTVIPAVTVGQGSSTSPAAIAVTVTVPAVTTGAGQSASPAAIAVVVAVPAVTTGQGQATSPATIVCTVSFPGAVAAWHVPIILTWDADTVLVEAWDAEETRIETWTAQVVLVEAWDAEAALVEGYDADVVLVEAWDAETVEV